MQFNKNINFDQIGAIDETNIIFYQQTSLSSAYIVINEVSILF